MRLGMRSYTIGRAQRLLARGQVARTGEQSSRCPSRASSACGGSSFDRAAASSIASGRPSRRTQISATAGAFAFVTVEVGLDGAGPFDEERDRVVLRERRGSGRCAGSGRASGGTGNSCSAERWSGAAAGDEQLQPGAAASSSATCGAASSRCSKLSRTSSSRCSARMPLRLSASGTAPLSREPERLRDRRQHELGVGERRERDEEHALRELLDELGRGLEREPGLARAARPGQRQQAHVLAPEPLDDRGQLPRSRPISGVGWTGRFVGRFSSVRSGGNSLRSPSITSCESRCGRSRSLSRCSPRSRSATPVGELGLDQLARRLRDQHLPAVAGRADPRRARDVEADVAGRAEQRLAGVDPDPGPQLGLGQRRAGRCAAA